MLTGQCISRFCVIERLFIKADYIKAATMVFTVTGKAILSRYVTGSMIAFALIDPGLKFLVALQAFGVRDFFAKIMALGAINYTFQVRMKFCEVTG